MGVGTKKEKSDIMLALQKDPKAGSDSRKLDKNEKKGNNFEGGFLRSDSLRVDAKDAELKGVVVDPNYLKYLEDQLHAGQSNDIIDAFDSTFTGMCIAHLLNSGYDVVADSIELKRILTNASHYRNEYVGRISEAKNFFDKLGGKK